MAKLTAANLLPGKQYAVQVRATDGTLESPWSTAYTFTAGADSISPNPVTSLVGTVSGSTYIVEWVAPTTNTDGTELVDLKGFVVNVTNGVKQANVFVTDTTYSITAQQNTHFFGTLQASLTFTVYAIDTSGNYYTPAPTIVVSAPPPGPITNLVCQSFLDAIGVSFSPPVTGADVDHYEVYFSTDGGTNWSLVYSGTNTNLNIPDVNYVATNIAVDSVSGFGVHTRVVYGGTITPRSSTAIDTTPPSPPDTVVLTEAANGNDPTGSTRQLTVTWTKTTIEPDLGGFLIMYKQVSAASWSYINISDDTARSTIITGLFPNVSYYVQVAAYDYTDNVSTYTQASVYPILTGKDTTPPSTPAAPAAVGTSSYDRIQVSCSGYAADGITPLASDMAYYEVYISTSSSITPTKTGTGANYFGNILVSPTLPGGVVIPSNGTFTMSPQRLNDSDSSSSVTYYVAVIAVDVNGNSSALSAVATATVGLISGLNVQTATITDANIQTLTATKIIAGTGLINNLSVFSTLVLGTQGQSSALGNISPQPGLLQSSNYVTGVSGFQLSSTGLEIVDGTIQAKALLLQNGQNIVPAQYADFEFSQNYYNAILAMPPGLTATIDTSIVKYNNQSLQVVNTTGSTTGVTLGASSTDYNMTISNPGATYIISVWVNSPQTLRPYATLKTNDGVTLVPSGLPPSIPANTWTRVSGTVTTLTSISKAVGQFYVPAGSTVNFDGFQVEQQTGGLTTPSPWKPPSMTAIDGGMIRTGSIQSNILTTYGGVTQPAWSINMAGGAVFADATVLGHLIIGGGAGTIPTDQFIQSVNYSVGTTGWRIDGSGNVDVTGGTISGSVVQTAATGQRMVLDGTTDSLLLYSADPNEITPGSINAVEQSTSNPAFTTVGVNQMSAVDSSIELIGHSWTQRNPGTLVQRVNTQAFTGSWSLQGSVIGGGTVGVQTPGGRLGINVLGAQAYTLTAEMKGQTAGSVTFSVTWYTAAGTPISSTSTTAAIGTSWAAVSNNVMSPNDAAFAQIWFTVTGTSIVWVDAIGLIVGWSQSWVLGTGTNGQAPGVTIPVMTFTAPSAAVASNPWPGTFIQMTSASNNDVSPGSITMFPQPTSANAGGKLLVNGWIQATAAQRIRKAFFSNNAGTTTVSTGVGTNSLTGSAGPFSGIFTAPPSGSIMIIASVKMKTTAGFAQMGVRILDASNNVVRDVLAGEACYTEDTVNSQYVSLFPMTGLVGNATYTAAAYFLVASGATGNFDQWSVTVVPSIG